MLNEAGSGRQSHADGSAPAASVMAPAPPRERSRERVMRSALDDRQLRFALCLALLAVLSAALGWLRQSTHGFPLRDSVNYIALARNLVQCESFARLWQGECLVRWNGAPFETIWPPGYSFLLAAVSLGRFDPLAVAGPFNVALLGATVFAAGHWLQRRIASRFLVFWGCLVLASAAPLLALTATVMSDLAFVLCVTLALSQIDSFLVRGQVSRLAAAAACAGLAALTRYVGLPLIAAGSALLAVQPGIRLRTKAVRTGAFALAALAPLGAWLYRNYRVAGAFTYMDQSPMANDKTLAGNVVATLETLGQWALFALVNAGYGGRVALPVLAALLAVVGLGFFLWRRDVGHRDDYVALLVCVAFVLAYCGFVAVATLSSYLLPPHSRYLAPTYVPLLFAFVFVADKARLHLQAHRDVWLVRALPPFLKTLLLAWVGCGLFLSVYTSLFPQRTRNSLHWAASPTMQYMRTHLATGWIFSNLAYQAYMQADMRTQHRWLPGPRLGDLTLWLATRRQHLDDTYVVFFHGLRPDAYHPYRFSVADLRAQADLELLADLADGTVFRVAPRAAPRPGRTPADFEAWTADAPVLQDVFDVHLAADKGTLYFVKASCAWDDTELKFALHAVPLRRRDLPSDRRALGFDNLDFPFGRYGQRVDDRCLAAVPLPAYPLDRLRIGQFASVPPVGAGTAWQADIPGPFLSPAAIQALRADWTAATAGVPRARAFFDVYATPDAVRFAKSPCRPADTQPKFILHVVPARRWRLARPWRPAFENLDFAFADRDGVLFKGRCWVRVPLPDYALDRIRVGQFDSASQRNLWQETLSLHPAPE